MENNQTKIWERANVFYQSTRKPINLLIAFNADAAAASATVMSLLKTSLIPFQAHPIATYDELTDAVREANLGQEVARFDDTMPLVDEFFLLIGLGAAVNVRHFFDLTRHVVVVLDAWRPVHLENLRAEDGVRLMLWGSPRIREEVDTFFRDQRQHEARRRRQRRRKDDRRRQKRLRHEYNRSGQPAERRAADADEDTVSSVNSQDGPRRRRHADDFAEEEDLASRSASADSSDSDSDDGALSGGDEEDEDAYVAGFSSQEETLAHWSEAAVPDEDGLVEDPVAPPLRALYYASECAGKSCALEAYELAVLLSRLKAPMLWHAAVGVCDLFGRRLIDYGTYLVEMQQVHDAVSLLQQTTQHVLDTHAEEATNAPAEGAASIQLNARATSNNMQLSNVDEELLYLLRHLSLWDAIWCHPLMASVLRLHHVEDGEGFLSQLLASRCGVSRDRAHQPWRELPHEVRRDSLPRVQAELQRLLEHAAGFVTHTTQLRCVARAVGYSTDVSTFDAFHLFEAVLSATPPASLFVVEDADLAKASAEMERRGLGSGSDKTPLELARYTVRARLGDFHRQRFWLAHAVLDVDPSETLFRAAVQDAVDLQRSIADATGALMQPGLLQSTRGVHYVLPQEALKTTAALESFISVPRLEALGTRLLYTLGVERKRTYVQSIRPLLISAAMPEPVLRLRDAASGRGNMTSGRALDFSASAGGSAARGAGAGAWSAAAAASPPMREDSAYLIVLVHQGATRSGLTPIADVGRFLSCIEDEEEFATGLPQRPFTDLHAVLLKDREVATHVVELMHLRSLDRWDPRQAYMARLAAQEAAQQLLSDQSDLKTNLVADDTDEDEEDDEGGPESGKKGGRRGHGSGGAASGSGDSHRSSVGLLA